jgi:hypothetical protein
MKIFFAVVIENFNENIMEKTIIGSLFLTIFVDLINGHTLAYTGHAHEGQAHAGHAHEGQAHEGHAHADFAHAGKFFIRSMEVDKNFS